MDKLAFSKIEAYMRSCMADSAHDQEHIYRVLNNALVIAEAEENVSYDVLIAACLLHDIARQAQLKDPNICHAEAGARIAEHFLLSAGYQKEFASAVASCILTHRFRKNRPPESLEAKILFDADKLDVVGAVGIARTLAYQGTIGAPLYSRDGAGCIRDGSQDTQPSFFREYHFKLKKLYDRFYTQKGEEIAQQRQAAAAAFYDSIYKEIHSFDLAGKQRLEELLRKE